MLLRAGFRAAVRSLPPRAAAFQQQHQKTAALVPTLTRAITSSTPLQSARSNRALELKYVDGTCTLAVPLPLNGFDEERVFSFPPESTVADVLKKIEGEDQSVQTVELRNKRGKSFKPEDTLQQVLTDDFELWVNERVLPVTAPVFTGNAYVSMLDSGELDVKAVAQKSAVISLRHQLETMDQWKITYADFVQMCRDNGIPKKQAAEILRSFHQSGIVFFFGNASEEDLQQTIFLQPRSILDSYLESIGLSPVSSQLFTQHREQLLAKIQALEPEHVALQNLYNELHKSATRHANGVAYALSTGLVGTFGLYFWLSFIHFSWDIMEPVTYFTGFGVSIVGYTWWSITNQEYEYENVYDYFYKKKLHKLATKASFDYDRLHAVTGKLTRAKVQVAELDQVLTKPTHLQAKYLHLLESGLEEDDDVAAKP